jgi:hypothetical protein
LFIAFVILSFSFFPVFSFSPFQCVEMPSLLYIAHIPDPLSLNDVNRTTIVDVSSPLARYLRQHKPDLLKVGW